MASIRKEMSLRARPEAVWDAVRDVGAIHTRLAPDFVTDTRLERDARIVTFANGMTAKELIVDVDDQARRLVWAVVEGRPRHHHGSIQIFPEGAGGPLIWIAELLRDAPGAAVPRLR